MSSEQFNDLNQKFQIWISLHQTRFDHQSTSCIIFMPQFVFSRLHASCFLTAALPLRPFLTVDEPVNSWLFRFCFSSLLVQYVLHTNICQIFNWQLFWNRLVCVKILFNACQTDIFGIFLGIQKWEQTVFLTLVTKCQRLHLKLVLC